MRVHQYSAASGSELRTDLCRGRDLVVELLAALVEPSRAVGQHLRQGGIVDATVIGHFGGDLQQGQRAADVAVGGTRDQRQRRRVNDQRLRTEATLAIGQRPLRGSDDVLHRDCFQHARGSATAARS